MNFRNLLKIKLFLLKNNSPRWIIFLIDIGISLFALIAASVLTSKSISLFDIGISYYTILLFGLIRSAWFIISRTYAGIIRYTSTRDIRKVFYIVTLSDLSFLLLTRLDTYFTGTPYFFNEYLIIVEYFLSVNLLILFRLFTKALYTELFNFSRNKSNVIIFGSKEPAILTYQAIILDQTNNYKVIGFMDDGKYKKGIKLEGLPTYNFSKIKHIFKSQNIKHLIIAKRNLSGAFKDQLVDICLNYNVHLLTLPNLQNWDNRSVKLNQIKNFEIKDLLDRPPIILNKETILRSVHQKIIMITGAAGSIGSEIVRQLIPFSPEKIILVDQAESPLYDIELEITEKYGMKDVEVIIADITDKVRMQNIFQTHKPSIVYHAAAYKHVPMMEAHASEAARNNILGTKTVADLAVEYNVARFIMVSTDKAVRPTNVMGATKRVAELYIQSLNEQTKTRFITTRFGNVLGSNGSVIPRFKKQIEDGGPITVTHEEVTRYFMTIPEACQLVLEAGAMGKGGEIFLFDMGKQVKIANLARKMIKLAGLKVDEDIKIKFTGLRPGEKLYEELLNDEENTLPTHHPKIMIARKSDSDHQFVKNMIFKIENTILQQDDTKTVVVLKKLVHEFISNNSKFEHLDKKQ